jgi:hypothetical protein
MLNEPRPIPRRSPEEIAADARSCHGNDEKVATTPIKGLVVRGVRLQSRYGKAEEYEFMQDIILAMGPLAGLLKSFFCDSKSGYCYDGVLREWGLGLAQVALQALQDAFLQSNATGYVNIELTADDGTLFGDATRCVRREVNW